MPDDHSGDQEGENVRCGEGVQQTVQAEEKRQNDGESNTQNDLAGHGNNPGEQGLAQSLKVDKGTLVHHGQNHHAQVDTEALDGKGGVISALVARAEDPMSCRGKSSTISVAARPTMASAALDAETARTVTDSLLNLKGLTRVVVTHRLEPWALSRYDGIIVMKNGRVSEQGSFDGLMEAKNQFYALFVLANG